MIKGGYILQPRVFDESEASKLHPVARELWFYLIRKVNHKDNGKFKRGQGFFNYKDIQDGLSWHVGFRKETYSKTQIYKALRRLNEGSMTTTTKTTRGILVTICNYDFYQTPKNYEDYNERDTKTTMGPHDKQECKECKNYKIKRLCPDCFPCEDIKTQFKKYTSSKKWNGNHDQLIEDFLIYHSQNGNKWNNWYSALQKWVRNDIKFHGLPQISAAEETERRLKEQGL